MMMGVVVEEVHEDVAPSILKHLARGVLIPVHLLQPCFVKAGDVANDAIVLVGARHRQIATFFVNDSIETVGVVALAGQPLEPKAIGQRR